MVNSLLRPILGDGPDEARGLCRAVAVDPALVGRATVDHAGAVILTGPIDGPPPASAKDRRRWELHVRLRLAAELGEAVAALVPIRWRDSPTAP